MYTAHATAIAGRNGHVESSDGLIKVDMTVPKEMGGPGKPGATNPEQLFAAGYAACFGGAIAAAAGAERIKPEQIKVTADVKIDKNDTGFFLAVTLNCKLDGIERADAERFVKKAHEEICPYSKATRNNVDVKLIVQ